MRPLVQNLNVVNYIVTRTAAHSDQGVNDQLFEFAICDF